MNYDPAEINFTEIYTAYEHAFAVTSKGELYGWGCNIY